MECVSSISMVMAEPTGSTSIMTELAISMSTSVGALVKTAKALHLIGRRRHRHTPRIEIDYRHNFYFGRVKPRSFRADGGPTRADRIILHRIGFHEDDESYSADLKIQTNLGVGGTKLKGDGVFYCDMFGSGSDGEYFLSALITHDGD